MQKFYLWTHLKARLKHICTTPGGHYHWLFLPGGPGLGSESLSGLTNILSLPGTMWYLDLPGDGSNVTQDDTDSFSHWSEALVEAVGALDNVILVAHSSGGMFALATPELEKMLSGLILMDSAPDASWQQGFMEYVKKQPLAAEISRLQNIYEKNPSNDHLKKFTLACAPWFSIEAGLKKNISLFNTLPYNFKSYEWAAKHFDQTYKAKWIPQNIPVLIFAGDEDHLTPIHLFTSSNHFQRENIIITAIKNASHFPWNDNPDEVIGLFKQYCLRLTKSVQ